MKAMKFVCIVLCVAGMIFCSTAWAAKTVVVISGVSKESAIKVGYGQVFEGIKEGFKPAGIEPVFQWVELDTLATEELKAVAGAKALAEVRKLKPDLIVTLNDDCLKYVGTKVDDLPVVFAWIFGHPQTLGLPKANITGVTRGSYAVDTWIMAKQLTGAKTVALLSKDSNSMAGVKQYLAAGADKLEAASGVRYKDMYLLNTFAEWEKAVNDFAYDFIYLADTSRIIKDGKELTRAETVGWTVEHAKVPVIAASETDVEAGALYAIVTSERTIGNMAAESAIKILNGAKLADVPYVTTTKGKLVINVKTANKYKIEIPYDILSSAEKIYE
ncbi:MAG: hypothetical protein KKD44_09835 [Proteobacteria bacterium]|nr:hypothetical protein [Pseudomonadota bacterium]